MAKADSLVAAILGQSMICAECDGAGNNIVMKPKLHWVTCAHCDGRGSTKLPQAENIQLGSQAGWRKYAAKNREKVVLLWKNLQLQRAALGCNCHECLAGDALPTHLQGLPGAFQLPLFKMPDVKITGTRADVFLIDDPYEDANQERLDL
jgi:hypothetical protein